MPDHFSQDIPLLYRAKITAVCTVDLGSSHVVSAFVFDNPKDALDHPVIPRSLEYDHIASSDPARRKGKSCDEDIISLPKIGVQAVTTDPDQAQHGLTE